MSKAAESKTQPARASRGYWSDTWRHFRQHKLSMIALGYVFVLATIAVYSPAIVGTKPIICKYKGKIYFPAMGYYNPRWESAVFYRDKFRRVYPGNLKKKDPESWAIWPLVYQDPIRRVRDGEWEGQPANPTREPACAAPPGSPARATRAGGDRRCAGRGAPGPGPHALRARPG